MEIKRGNIFEPGSNGFFSILPWIGCEKYNFSRPIVSEKLWRLFSLSHIVLRYYMDTIAFGYIEAFAPRRIHTKVSRRAFSFVRPNVSNTFSKTRPINIVFSSNRRLTFVYFQMDSVAVYRTFCDSCEIVPTDVL